MCADSWQPKPSKERPVLGEGIRGLKDYRPPADPARRGELEVRAGHSPEEVHRGGYHFIRIFRQPQFFGTQQGPGTKFFCAKPDFVVQLGHGESFPEGVVTGSCLDSTTIGKGITFSRWGTPFLFLLQPPMGGGRARSTDSDG